MAEDQQRRPDPDPTVLTTANLQREVATLKEQLQNEIAAEIKVVNARIAGLEKAVEKADADYTRVPTDVQKAVGNLQALHEVKFDLHAVKFEGVQVQLRERDAKVAETALATKTAVDAALSAAEKATSKQAESFSEAAEKAGSAFTKAIDQQAALYQTETRALRDICNAMDRRLTVIEGQAIGQQGAKTDTHMSSSFIVSIIGVGIAIISSIIAAVALTHPFK